jgi:hypothetical protein
VPNKKLQVEVKESLPPAEEENLHDAADHQINYKVEAIVWSENPKSCFAVINGQIVKTGDNVEGARVVSIGRKSVSIKSGRHTRKIRFGLE